ncbi:MAG: MBL fold metallo-hydrolase [Myxococcota bacterium]
MPRRLLFASLLLCGSCSTNSGTVDRSTTPPTADGAAKDPFADVQIKATPVAGSVFVLEGAGGNIAVCVGPDGVLIVDDQFAPLAPKIRKAIAALRPDKEEGPLKFVLNTHWHSDHTGGNQVFGDEAVVVAHDNVRTRMHDGLEVGDRKVPASPAVAWPVVTFGESMSLHFNGERIRLEYLAGGHTDGDAMVIFEGSKVVHMGDDFVTYGFPFVDVHSGGSVSGLTRSVAKAIERIPPDYRVIPGHGEISTVEDMKRFHRMLTETTATVAAQRDAGASLAEAQKAGVGSEYADWAGDFVDEAKWIELVWASLDEPGA